MRSINFKKSSLARFALFAVCGLALLSCNGAPQKPQVVMCIIDYPANEAICGLTDTTQTTRVPLSTLDKATAFTPDEWQKLMDYKDQLEAWGQTHCQSVALTKDKKEKDNGGLSE